MLAQLDGAPVAMLEVVAQLSRDPREDVGEDNWFGNGDLADSRVKNPDDAHGHEKSLDSISDDQEREKERDRRSRVLIRHDTPRPDPSGGVVDQTANWRHESRQSLAKLLNLKARFFGHPVVAEHLKEVELKPGESREKEEEGKVDVRKARKRSFVLDEKGEVPEKEKEKEDHEHEKPLES